jgi:hypothetical protein
VIAKAVAALIPLGAAFAVLRSVVGKWLERRRSSKALEKQTAWELLIAESDRLRAELTTEREAHATTRKILDQERLERARENAEKARRWDQLRDEAVATNLRLRAKAQSTPPATFSTSVSTPESATSPTSSHKPKPPGMPPLPRRSKPFS